MEIEDYIEKIIKDGDIEEMHKLSEVLEDVMELLKEYDMDSYKKYEMCLYKMAYGCVLNKEMAEEIVSKMKPYRMKWDIEQTKEIQNQFGLDDIRPVDFFIVMNAMYNDYRDIFNEDVEVYARLTNDFINDEDAKEGKVFLYFTNIANN